MKKYIMALDQGTTSSRCIIFDKSGSIVSCAQEEYRQIYPKPGWVEHDPEDIWSSQFSVAKKALESAGLSYPDIAAIGITNQRESTIVWDRATGKPIYNAIVWQCRRSADICDKIKESGYDRVIREKTGLVVDAYFSLTKIKWILDNVEGARALADAGRLAFGTVDSWLIWKLTEGREHLTDVSNASRTMMFNIRTMEWDKQILERFDIPVSMLPKVCASSGSFGHTELFGGRIDICGVAGDQQASLFGQGCFDVGEVKNTYGTGGFMLMNVGHEPIFSENGLVSTVAWQIGNEISYAIEGSVFVSGAAVQWLRDGLKIIESSPESEALATSVDSTDGVYFVPAFTGLGAPYWNPDARGLICGISRGTERAHIVRATLEAMAYQTDDVLKLISADSGIEIKTLRVDGGAAANSFLVSFQADISDIATERPRCIETTALGAAYLAGLGCGLYTDLSEIRSLCKAERVFLPDMKAEKREELIRGWHNAVRRTL